MAGISSFRMVTLGGRSRVDGEDPSYSQGPPTCLPQLLFQESNPGVRYEYTIHREADGHGQVQLPEFSWHYGPWTKCTVTCGTGEERGGHSCCPAGPLSLGRDPWLQPPAHCLFAGPP